MTVEAAKQIEATLAHHLQALGDGDVEAILSDYTDDSVVYSPQGPVRGLDQLRAMFAGTVASMPNFLEGFHILRQDCEGEVAYLVWQKDRVFPLGTDTYLIRDGKILVQTFAAYSPS
jgi:ketosteroid isomerase-like protein